MLAGKRNELRGQLFAADVIIAILIMTVALGATLHQYEFAVRTTSRAMEIATNNAESIAFALANNVTVNASAYCYQYSNGTGNCNAFSCGGNTYSSRMLVECGPVSGVCSLEVHACG